MCIGWERTFEISVAASQSTEPTADWLPPANTLLLALVEGNSTQDLDDWLAAPQEFQMRFDSAGLSIHSMSDPAHLYAAHCGV